MEKIKDKLLKIKALADSGKTHESRTASLHLSRLLSKYNLTIKDLESELQIDYFIPFSNTTQKKLLIQVVVSNGLEPYRVTKNNKHISKIGISTTPIKYSEIINEYQWHKSNFRNEMKDFLSAYIHKHNLYPTNDLNSSPSKELSEKEIIKLVHLANSMSDDFYNKKRLFIQSPS